MVPDIALRASAPTSANCRLCSVTLLSAMGVGEPRPTVFAVTFRCPTCRSAPSMTMDWVDAVACRLRDFVVMLAPGAIVTLPASAERVRELVWLPVEGLAANWICSDGGIPVG